MPKTRFSLLEEPLLRVRLSDGSRRVCSLPEVLELLGADRIASFEALQAFQTHAWHAFLVQLASIALARSQEKSPVAPAAIWAKRLRGLTAGDEAWCLHVEDLGKPAFMQPPVPEGSLEGFKEPCPFPDKLDVLVTAKNHDVKAGRIGRGRPEHWVYALVSLQTTQGFLGQSNYGIARMNGGFGSRPGLGFAPGLSAGSHFMRDVGVLLAARPGLEALYSAGAKAPALIWLVPWDGKTSLALAKCDPFFIEVCRRVRLTCDGDALAAYSTGSEVVRIDGKAAMGNTGDAWTPVDATKNTALTISGSGMSYRLMQELLLGQKFRPGAALSVAATDPAQLVFVGRVLPRGQGKTEGFHERLIPVPGKIRIRLGKPDARAALEKQAQHRIGRVADVQQKALKLALLVLLQADPGDHLKWKDERPARWLDGLDSAVDRIFFERLWEHAELDPEEADRLWTREVVALARVQLEEAFGSTPLPEARRLRSVAAALRAFEGMTHKLFHSVLQPQEVA